MFYSTFSFCLTGLWIYFTELTRLDWVLKGEPLGMVAVGFYWPLETTRQTDRHTSTGTLHKETAQSNKNINIKNLAV